MNKEKKSVGVYIGRFQPMHFGHVSVIKEALLSNKYKHIIFMIGSADKSNTPKNPFTYAERKQLISNIFQNIIFENKIENVKLSIFSVCDLIYDNNKWINAIQKNVSEVTSSDDEIYLLGADKDESTSYLKYFPQYKSDFTDLFLTKKEEHKNRVYLDATDIRNVFIDKKYTQFNKNVDNALLELKKDFSDKLPNETIMFLANYVSNNHDSMCSLVKEMEYLKSYKKQMLEKLPYKNIPFFTVDTLVCCSGHVLLVERGRHPGKGLYAMPGGFFDGIVDNDFQEAAIRELVEETGIKVSKKELIKSIKSSNIFSDKNRSERWRIITNTFFIQLDGNELPVVKGGDDAANAVWVSFSDLGKYRNKLFEDHASIIDVFLNVFNS